MRETVRKLRMFLSSPGDVREEREIVKQVSEKITLSPLFKNAAHIDLIRWEDLLASGVSAKDCDIFVMILWNRWGTPVPVTGSDGAMYTSGTQYEFEVALEQAKRTGRPKMLVYRRVSPLQIPSSTDPGSLHAIVEQKEMVDEFFDSLRDEQGAARLVYHTFKSPADFQSLFESHLTRLVRDELMESGPPVERLVRGAELSSVLPTEKSGGLFLSYRREDSQWAAGRMADKLRAEFNDGLVFLDVDAIPLGANFSEEIERWLGECDLLLAVVGPGWLTATGKAGKRRIDNPTDLVRCEIEIAFKHGIPVVPVFLDDTQAVEPDDLPDSLADFASRQAVWIRCKHFRSDMEGLVARLRAVLDHKTPN